MTAFTEYFWGEKNNGFDVLYHNMKYGQDSCKEFADFLRESCSVEEAYSKLLAKLAKYTGNCGNKGSFGPYWTVLKTVAEKLSSLHQTLAVTWQELLKDVNKYNEEQHKKHKAIKDQETSTMDTVQNMQQTSTALQKAKESYHARCVEYEKLKRENGTLKDLEKAEAKFKKAHDDYRSLVDKYSNVRKDFEEKMTEACKRFQEVEENHLTQMKEYVEVYHKAWENQHDLLGKVHEEFRDSSQVLNVENLMTQLIHSKTTGTERPGPIEFVEADFSSLSTPVDNTPEADKKDFPVIEKPKKEGEMVYHSNPDLTLSKPNSTAAAPLSLLDRTLPLRASTGWIWKKKRKEKKKKKKEEREKEAAETNSLDQVPKVDEEGYSIRPDNIENHNDNNSWYSSSDSDSDGDEKKNKIKVEIKPVVPTSNTSAVPVLGSNIDEIRKSIEGLRLSPSTMRRQTSGSENTMKKSVSLSDSLSSATTVKPSQELLTLDIFGSVSSSASTPTGGYTFPSPMASMSLGNTPVTTPSNNNSVEVSTGVGDVSVPPLVPARQRSQTPTGAPLLPGPPPPRPAQRNRIPSTATARPAGRQTPDIFALERTDSVPSLNSANFSTTSASFGSSRGPSPLTIGHADTVPLAVAFSETVNAYFKGDDEMRCKVKLTGDLMLSFPAGIARVLTDNPSPASLAFRVNNSSSLEHVLVNKQLLTEDSSQATGESRKFTFDMHSLTEHLRKQAEQNKSASYFNIDIIKYQIRAKPGTQSVPVKLTTKWKCSHESNEFRLDYQLNPSCLPHVSSLTLSNVSVLLPVEEEIRGLVTVPPEHTRTPDNKRVVWKLGEIPGALDQKTGDGIIRARYDRSNTLEPGSPSPVALQFVSEGSSLSGVDFELIGTGYRVSLVKKRFTSGKYIADTDSGAAFV